jgi:hypothetical protein
MDRCDLLQLGGNAALIKFFKEHGVDTLSIKEKYNTPAAELYRERCVIALLCDRISRASHNCVRWRVVPPG